MYTTHSEISGGGLTVRQGKAWLALAPFSGAALVAISRTMDYRRM